VTIKIKKNSKKNTFIYFNAKSNKKFIVIVTLLPYTFIAIDFYAVTMFFLSSRFALDRHGIKKASQLREALLP